MGVKEWWWCGKVEVGAMDIMRKKGGWVIMKKKVLQYVVYSAHALGGGGQILKWWGGDCSKGRAHYVWWLEANERWLNRGT